MKEGWEYKKLGSIATYINGFAFTPNDWGSEGKPIIRIQNLTDNTAHFNRCKRSDIPEKYKVVNGDVLISWSATLGVFEWKREDSWLNQHIFKVVFDKIEINKQYFIYIVESSLGEMAKHTNGATMRHIRKGDFDNIHVPVPSIKVQEEIVAYLDSAFSKIDAMKANAEKALNEAKALFQASLKEIFEPKDNWAEKKFGKLCEFVRGPFGGSLKKECFVDSGYAVYEQQNAIYNKFTFRYFIDQAKYNSLKRFKVNSGDLIMSCSGTIGKVAIIPEEFKEGIINQALLKLTPNKEIDAHFLKYLMESNYFEEIINANIEGVAIKNIASVAILKEIKLYIPEIGEQYLIVTKIDLLKSKVDRLQSNFDKISQECDALKQAILRQVFE